MLRLGLERHGFRVWGAANGSEAVQLCRELGAEVAVVLLEIGMHGMDGLPTLELLLRQNPQAVVCFMSGGGEYTYDELIRRGARHVFAKPLLLDELARTLLAFVPASAVILPEPGPTVGR
jgi:CheY-like chemotaxis protein